MKEQRPLLKLPTGYRRLGLTGRYNNLPFLALAKMSAERNLHDVQSRTLASRNASNELRSDYDAALGTVGLMTLKDAGAEGLAILNRPIILETLGQAKEIKGQSAPINSNSMSSQFIATGPAPSLPKDVLRS
ncbi:hypothetical protein LTR17_021059 [Elasticomyces elasticus]|nr:hypothetical protein LTR17_021059 [Elasticomyces elasticus]